MNSSCVDAPSWWEATMQEAKDNFLGSPPLRYVDECIRITPEDRIVEHFGYGLEPLK